MIRGRPVRFVALLLGGWTLMRFALLNSQSPVPGVAPIPDFVAPYGPGLYAHKAATPVLTMPARAATLARVAVLPLWQSPTVEPPGAGAGAGWSRAVADDLLDGAIAFVRRPREGLALRQFAPGAGLAPEEASLPPAAGVRSLHDRWSGAAWLLFRPQSPGKASLVPRLGGSQAGVRLDYALAPDVALYGRLSGALGQGGTEAAAGFALRPVAVLPITLGAERRQAVSAGGRSDVAALVAGGFDGLRLGDGFRLGGYGQAGVVGMASRDVFADGRISMERSLNVVGRAEGSRPDLAIGASLWGAAQPDAARVDVGPSAVLRLRIGGTLTRLSAEWRERVAGDARPPSGLALSIGTDF